MTNKLLEVDGLKKYYDEENSALDRLLGLETPPVRAVDDVSFSIEKGRTFGLVGESGCGKSTVGKTILRMLQPTAGEARFDGRNIYDMNKKELVEFRKNAQIIYQDPFSSLNPRMTIGNILQEPLNIHDIGTKVERRQKAEEILELVGLSMDQLDRYPHEFSGGQRQRICIARALILEPDFILLDEPVSALDVSVQAQVLNLLNDLQEKFDLTYLFIAHDLGVVRYLCDEVAVMYLGKIAEVGPTEKIFRNPKHPYTEALLESIPRADIEEKDRAVLAISGDVPSPRNPPTGCRFHTRCQKVIQPEEFEFDQPEWISIVSLWSRLDTDPESLEEYVAEEDGDPDWYNQEVRDAFEIPERLDDHEAESVVSSAVEAVTRGDFDEARLKLNSKFSTVCRTDHPRLVEIDEKGGHRSACYLAYDGYEDVRTKENVESTSA